MRLSTGVRLGPYEVVALLGAGGMAEVYRARRIGLVEAWDHEGPPDLCQRVEAGKYVCR